MILIAQSHTGWGGMNKTIASSQASPTAILSRPTSRALVFSLNSLGRLSRRLGVTATGARKECKSLYQAFVGLLITEFVI